MGIVYQNVQKEIGIIEPLDMCMEDGNNNGSNVRRRRKYLSEFNSSVETYVKPNQKPSLKLAGREPIFPDMWEKAVNLNNMWMLNHAFKLDGTKRWFAWNSERMEDKNPIQNIGYLPNLNMSPTSDAVVLKTLEIAQKIAEETNQNRIIVTYDLAIASKAYRIQANLAPRFDNIFINMGAFHTELSFFKVRY